MIFRTSINEDSGGTLRESRILWVVSLLVATRQTHHVSRLTFHLSQHLYYDHRHIVVLLGLAGVPFDQLCHTPNDIGR